MIDGLYFLAIIGICVLYVYGYTTSNLLLRIHVQGMR